MSAASDGEAESLPHPDQHTFLEQLVTKISRHNAIIFEQKRRASVAVIIRVKPKNEIDEFKMEGEFPGHGNNYPLDCILSVINSKTVREGSVEMLYIKRAVNVADRWSGHVAFPGGHVEAGESPQQAAERETKEEIGIDLSDGKNFAVLGRLDDRAATDTLSVSTFVYLQISSSTPPMRLDQKEVAGVLWVPVKMFLENTNAMLIRPHVVQLYMGPKFLKKSGLLDFLGLSSVHFPSLLLPNLHDSTLEYILWGLTLGITSEIYVLGADRVPLHKPLFRFENRLANGLMEVSYGINSFICPGKDINYRTMFQFVFGGMTMVFIAATALVVKSKF